MPSEIRIHRRIEEIDPALWDAPLGPDDLQATHRFVRACQESALHEAEYRHLVVLDGSRVMGTATLFRMVVALELLAGPRLRRGLRAVRRLAPRLFQLPVAFCGLPVSFGGSCLRSARAADAPLVAAAVTTALGTFGREVGAALQCVKELDPAEEARFAAPLTAAGFFAAPSIPSCALELRWPSYDGYVAAMRAPFRRQLRASAAALAQAGGRIRRVDDYLPYASRLFALYRQVMNRAPLQMEQLTLPFFVALKARFGAAAHALLVERDGEVLAAALVLESPRAHTFLIAGIDYRHHRQTHAYLALVADLVARAVAAGKDLLVLGQTSYHLKRRLGAHTTSRRIFLRHQSPLVHRLVRLSAGMLFPERRYPPLPVFKESR